MGGMVMHAEFALDHCRYPLGGPDLAAEAESLCPPLQQGGKVRPLCGAQSRFRSWGWSMAERLGSILSGTVEPLADGTGTDPEGCRNLPLGPAFLGQFPATQPAAFVPISVWLYICWLHTLHDTI